MSETAGERGKPPIVREARATVRNWVPYVLLVAAFFVAVAIVGAAVGHERRSAIVPIRSPGDPVPPLEPLDLFLHNGQVAALLIVGIVFFALPTVALLAYNAFLVGATTAAAVGSLGPLATAAVLIPHAVFELPAVWLAGAIALRWLHVIWQTTQGGKRRVSVGRVATETILAVVVVVVLLAVAAVVEGTITKEFARALT